MDSQYLLWFILPTDMGLYNILLFLNILIYFLIFILYFLRIYLMFISLEPGVDEQRELSNIFLYLLYVLHSF